MACCVIAAFLLAQFVAMLRRWAMFWGLIPVPAGEDVDTIFRRLSGWMARRDVRLALGTLVVVEFAMLGGWIYLDHGAHMLNAARDVRAGIARQGDFYADLCSEAYRRLARAEQ